MRRIVLEIPEELFAANREIVLRLQHDQAERPSKTEDEGVRDGFDFMDFIHKEAMKKDEHGHYRTAETYRSAATSLSRFLQGARLGKADLDASLMERYAMYLKEKGLKQNTVSFYLRRLNVLYGRAVGQGLLNDSHPFEKLSLRPARTSKRAIELKEMQRIAHASLRNKSQRLARDMFLFSFFTRGMAFVDMASLTRNNVRNGLLTYRRRKTGQELHIRWLPCMQSIVDRYCPHSHHLLPLVPDGVANEFTAYRTSQRRIGRNLKSLGNRFGIPNLTMYVARHSWATIALNLGVPTSVISCGMGHESERTTLIYLGTVNAATVDSANARVLSTLLGQDVSISGGGDRHF